MSGPERFDTSKKPIVPRPYLMPIEWVGSTAMLAAADGKIERINCEGLFPPYIMLSTHASFVDFPMAVKATFPHRSMWVISIEEFIGREWLMRNIGGIYKRKFTQDITVVRHILTALKKQKKICTIYPEARFSLAGINEQIDGALGSLVKTAGVPLVVFILHGNFLRSPQWNKTPARHVPVSGEFIQVVTREEAKTLSADEIQKRIENVFQYDEYRWQFENRIKIRSNYRAKNIHRILYQCPVCETEFNTDSDGTSVFCKQCGAVWEMDEYGQLHRVNGPETFTHVPDWYRWERENVKREVACGKYHFEDDVWLEKLVSGKTGFVRLGRVHLTHDANGFCMEGEINGDSFRFHRSVSSMYSCHIEYNFKGRGDAIDLCTLSETYFVFPINAVNVLTKLHFATEELYRVWHTANEREKAKRRAMRAAEKEKETAQ